jgi:hypothetical protein
MLDESVPNEPLSSSTSSTVVPSVPRMLSTVSPLVDEVKAVCVPAYTRSFACAVKR